MNKTKLYGVLAILFLLINLMLVGFILNKGRKRGKRKKSPKEIIITRLNLDSNQSADYGIKVQEHRSLMNNTHEKIRAEKSKLNNLLRTEDREQADSLFTVIAGLHREMELGFFNHLIDIKSICKPEQMDNYTALVDDINTIFSKRGPRRKGSHKKQ
ncbi:MAG: hypothetical protein P8N47_03780 [Bacteroidia bacterium]|jgi:hypothetical protein|nr:hypothetical protein [Bacteroidia bacterium]